MTMIYNVIITTNYKEGDINLQWEAKCGFGHLAFKLMPDGKIHCNNESMSREFVKSVLDKLVDVSIMDFERKDEVQEELPKTYTPSHLRPEEPKQREQVMYGIGQMQGDNGVGMWHGLTPSLDDMLEEAGRDNDSIIVRFNKDGTDEFIYSWDELEQGWIYIGED